MMDILDKNRGGYRVFVGDLGSRVGKYELEREFQGFGPILDVWVARCVLLEIFLPLELSGERNILFLIRSQYSRAGIDGW